MGSNTRLNRIQEGFQGALQKALFKPSFPCPAYPLEPNPTQPLQTSKILLQAWGLLPSRFTFSVVCVSPENRPVFTPSKRAASDGPVTATADAKDSWRSVKIVRVKVGLVSERFVTKGDGVPEVMGRW